MSVVAIRSVRRLKRVSRSNVINRKAAARVDRRKVENGSIDNEAIAVHTSNGAQWGIITILV